MTASAPGEIRHPVALRLAEAVIIALVTASITAYANHRVMEVRVQQIQSDLGATKARVEKIYSDIYCPYGRCPRLQIPEAD